MELSVGVVTSRPYNHQEEVAAKRDLLRREARSPVAIVREIVKAIQWLGQEQPPEAIGSVHGVHCESAFWLADRTEIYQLYTRVHTSVGKPGLVIAALEPVPDSEEIFWRDQAIFKHVISSVSGGNKVVAGWESPNQQYTVAVDVDVHPSLIRAMTVNQQQRCQDGCGDGTPCTTRLDLMARFRLPDGWTT